MDLLLLFNSLRLNLVPRQINFSDFVDCLDELASWCLVNIFKALETNHYSCDVVQGGVLN